MPDQFPATLAYDDGALGEELPQAHATIRSRTTQPRLNIGIGALRLSWNRIIPSFPTAHRQAGRRLRLNFDLSSRSRATRVYSIPLNRQDICELVWLRGPAFPDDEMGGAFALNLLNLREAERAQVDAGEQVLAFAQKDRREREVHFVDLPSRQVLADCRNAAADPDVLPAGRLSRPRERVFRPVGHEVERRPTVHRQRRAGVVGQDDDRRVVWRSIAPPPFPIVTVPRPA